MSLDVEQSLEKSLGKALDKAQSSHRARKKLATRRAIHEAAFDLVDQHGLSGVTIDAISEKAGVAPRTFWAYFSSKEDAVLDRDPTRAEYLRLSLLTRPAGEDTLTALRRVLETDLRDRQLDPEVALRKGQMIQSHPQLMAAAAAMFDEIERALADGVGDRLGRDPETDLFPGVIASAACGAYRAAHLRWSNAQRQTDLLELFDEAFMQLADGLTALVLERAALR